MNEKQQSILNELLSNIDLKYNTMFLELAEYAISLGYTPVRSKTIDVNIDFRKNKFKKTILKLEAKEQKHAGLKYGERDKPGLRMRFFAAKEYSDIFNNGIKNVIEEYDGRYTGCYGCGRCDGSEGYTFIYPDGRKVYRCGSELISVFDFTEKDVPEIKKLLKIQDDYYVEKLGS
ncbi:hypothetical protein JHL18_08605 [Clostridium sp. YIM B02505]|uniref:Phage protein n=1 Tax=Clostridium yunnanense TaxID=2800325 RepID=A0ABS1EMT8_9CLOT|nr:hypothetical protein [Clostridium yunnanense]MBK1810696.1 hypothetical protein [Clostridium yunnanense]